MSINAIGSMTNSLSSISASSSATSLTEKTKKQLEALGIDTSKIKTEAEGQQKLKEAQAAQASQQNQSPNGHQQQNVLQMQAITQQIEFLASRVGVSISSNDKIPDVINNISNKISDMLVTAGQDPQKVQQATQYQDLLNVISTEYTSLVNQQQASQNQLTGGMDNMALYNKLFHKL